MPASSPILDSAFQTLEQATLLEEEASTQSKPEKYISAASKYFEACSLLKRHINQSQSSDATTKLLLEKIDHYKKHASGLLQRKGEEKVQEDDAEGGGGEGRTQSWSNFEGDAAEVEILITEQAGRANARLSKALDLDEQGSHEKAIEEYIAAAKIYLDAATLADKVETRERKNLGDVLKRRLKAALDRAEKLKNPEQNQLTTETSERSLGGPRSSRSLTSTPQKQAPQIPFSPPPKRLTRDPSMRLSAAEIEVLKRSSLIASGLFMPWSDDEMESFDFACHSPTPWNDPDGLLKLSEKQESKLYKWARPSEIASLKGLAHKPIVMVHSITPYSIRQTCVTDCSFIASLCICASYERRFKRKLVTSLIYPQDRNGNPIYNKSGKYVVKLWLNGVARRVIVDDRFPVDISGNFLCSHTKFENGLELWVSIIEKAYLKLCGGYDFPGSNSGVDLFSLTGWIPERIHFPENEDKIRDFETPSERAWERLHGACSFGDCLVTVSTSSELTEKKADEVGLVTGHAYAVLSVLKTKKGVRLIQLKNPWAHKGWKGKYSPLDLNSWADPNLQAEAGYNPSLASKYDDGVFWISWDDVLVYFRNLHLSWNPSLFSSSITVHGLWPNDQGPIDDSFNIGENPQYVMNLSEEAIQKKASVWILLSRHVTKQEQEGSEAEDYLTLHIYRNTPKNERIWYPGGKNRVLVGAYTNNPHVLIRYDVTEPDDTNLSLVLSQYKKSNDLGYTMSCFCTSPFKLGLPVKLPRHKLERSSEWTIDTAGGPPSKGTFDINPKWTLKIPNDDVHVQFKCCAMKSLAINLMLFKGDTEGAPNVYSIMLEKPVMDTGDYRHGFVATSLENLPKGNYTLVASTFHPGETGRFIVTVFSTDKVTFEPVI